MVTDGAILGPGDSGTITGAGVAGSLTVSGTYTLTGSVDVAGSAAVSGGLDLLGNPFAFAALTDTSQAIDGAVAATYATLQTSGTEAIDGGSLDIRASGTAILGALAINTGTLEIGATGTVTVAGAIDSQGLIVSLGQLTASSLTLAPGARMLNQGSLNVDTLTVSTGALLDGARLVQGNTGTLATIVNDGTIEGAVAADPLRLDGAISGAGELLIDGGGGMALGGPVGAGQAVVFGDGITPVYVDSDGAAGGQLTLDDAAQFDGTIEGFSLGDRILVDPIAGQTVAMAVLQGGTLDLENAGGTILAGVAFDSSALPSGTTFSVAPPDPNDFTNILSNDSAAVEIVAIPPSDAAALTTSGAAITTAGLATTVPLVSAYDPSHFAGLEAPTNGTYSITLHASSGSLTELFSLPRGLYTLLLDTAFGTGNPYDPRLVGDGSLPDEDSTSGVPVVAVSGTGTDTLVISGNSPFYVDLQTALVLYQAGASAGDSTITATFSDGTVSSTSTIAVDVKASSGSYAWNPSGSSDAGNAANWTVLSGGVAGPPGSGDSITLGAGTYAITGDIAASDMAVTGNALTQGAIYLGGSVAGQPALMVDDGGLFGSAGFVYADGDAVIGGPGGGQADFAGIINNITGSLIVGGSGVGFVQVQGFVASNQDVLVGVGAAGQLDVMTDPVSRNGFGITGALVSANGTIGAGASGLVNLDNGDWWMSGSLVVGGSSAGVLDLSGDHGQLYASDVIVGLNASGTIYDNGDALNVYTLLSYGSAGGLITIGADDAIYIGSYDDDDNFIGGTIDVASTGGPAVFDMDGYGSTGTLIVGQNGTVIGSPDNATGLELTDLDVQAGGTLAITGAMSGTNYAVASIARFDGANVTFTGQGDIQSGGLLSVGGGYAGLGTLTVEAGGTLAVGPAVAGLNSVTSLVVDGQVVLNGGALTFFDSPASGPGTIEAGGRLSGHGALDFDDISGTAAVTNLGTIEAAGGTLAVDSRITGQGGVLEIGSGAALSIDLSQIDPSQAIRFDGNATLMPTTLPILSNDGSAAVTSFAAPIEDFGAGDTIDYKFDFDGTADLSLVSYQNGTLTLLDTADDYGFNGVGTVTFNIPTIPAGETFVVSNTGSTGEAFITMACFRSGTHIATPDGDVWVQDIVAGDTVMTADGRAERVVWAGRRTVDCVRHPRPRAIWPVRVAPHAFGPGLPAAPLFLSPDHAVFFDGVLIPVKCLINGGSVAQVEVDTVTYHHIELDRHDIILSEGLPTESYLDTGDRMLFAGDVMALHPEWGGAAAEVWEALGAAPLRLAGPEVEEARQFLEQKRVTRLAR
jgi:hypothetical protein